MACALIQKAHGQGSATFASPTQPGNIIVAIVAVNSGTISDLQGVDCALAAQGTTELAGFTDSNGNHYFVASRARSNHTQVNVSYTFPDMTGGVTTVSSNYSFTGAITGVEVGSSQDIGHEDGGENFSVGEQVYVGYPPGCYATLQVTSTFNCDAPGCPPPAGPTQSIVGIVDGLTIIDGGAGYTVGTGNRTSNSTDPGSITANTTLEVNITSITEGPIPYVWIYEVLSNFTDDWGSPEDIDASFDHFQTDDYTGPTTMPSGTSRIGAADFDNLCFAICGVGGDGGSITAVGSPWTLDPNQGGNTPAYRFCNAGDTVFPVFTNNASTEYSIAETEIISVGEDCSGSQPPPVTGPCPSPEVPLGNPYQSFC